VPAPSHPVPPVDREVVIAVGNAHLEGRLTVPEEADRVVVFAHGSGSSRYSPRNQWVAGELRDRGAGTLLFDLLERGEEADRANVFDIGLLGSRLVAVTAWLKAQPDVRSLLIGYFGASTGAAAALWAATEADVSAVVSRGGRPDLAASRLGEVSAPTLLIVGSLDTVVLELNRQALAELRVESELAVVEGASHLFEEPGALAQVAQLAGDWFVGHGDHPMKTTAKPG
jgi:putative phosphoribosyl transferase